MNELFEMYKIHEKLNEMLKEKKPEHFLVELDSGEEQTEFAEHITDFFQENDIRHFGGRESYLEYSLDGSMAQLKWIFGDIAASATYTNEYEGVIAMDIALLASKVSEAQMAYFLNEIKRVSKYATLLLFVSEVPSRNQDLMVKRVKTVIDNINYFPVETYQEDLQLVMGGK